MQSKRKPFTDISNTTKHVRISPVKNINTTPIVKQHIISNTKNKSILKNKHNNNTIHNNVIHSSPIKTLINNSSIKKKRSTHNNNIGGDGSLSKIRARLPHGLLSPSKLYDNIDTNTTTNRLKNLDTGKKNLFDQLESQLNINSSPVKPDSNDTNTNLLLLDIKQNQLNTQILLNKILSNQTDILNLLNNNNNK